MAVHTAQGRAEELPLDAASMIPGGKVVRLAKGAKLAAQRAVGGIGRGANTVQALGAADAFGRPAYANGGKIQGPGTPTSDSIPARVKETGEPIAVSTKERIVSAKQEMLLQRIAQGLGFGSVDAMFEAGTGKPVGPTIKGGKLAAASGMKPFERDYSIPADEQQAAVIAQANKQPAPPVVAKPIDLRANFETPDFSMAAADPKGYERARQVIAPEAPTVRQAATSIRAEQTAAQPIAEGLQERTFSRMLPQPQPSTTQPAQPETTQAQPASGGTATFRGKTVSLPKNEGYVDTAGNPTDDWTKTARYAEQMRVNDSMKRAADQMERNRYARDMQADITNPKVMLLAKANLDRMNQEDESQRQSIATGLDSRIKGNQLARSEQEQQMIGRLSDMTLTPDQRLSLRSDRYCSGTDGGGLAM